MVGRDVGRYSAAVSDLRWGRNPTGVGVIVEAWASEQASAHERQHLRGQEYDNCCKALTGPLNSDALKAHPAQLKARNIMMPSGTGSATVLEKTVARIRLNL